MKQDFEISPYVVFKIRIRKRYFQKTLLEKIYTRQFLVTTSGAHFNVWDTFSHQYMKGSDFEKIFNLMHYLKFVAMQFSYLKI